MFDNMSKTERRNFLYTLIALGVIFLAFSTMIILFSMKANEASFVMIDEGQYVKIDYDPRPFLDSQWTFSFNSYVKSVGSGQYQVEIYPFVTYFKFYFQDVDNNRPVAERYYQENEWIHPGEDISFKHTFYEYLFPKGIYLAKLRVELAYNNDTFYDSVDFNIEIRGSATQGEILAIVLPVAIIGLILLSTYLLQRALNKRMYETISVVNTWYYVFIYFRRRFLNKKTAKLQQHIPKDPQFDQDFAAVWHGMLKISEFKKRHFPDLGDSIDGT